MTPNPQAPWLHCDGEAVTYIVLMNREGVTGGINYVTTPQWVNRQPEEVPPQDLLAKTTLTAPLEGLGVIDERVAHHVTSVRHGEQGEACRSVLLMDFSELVPFRA